MSSSSISSSSTEESWVSELQRNRHVPSKYADFIHDLSDLQTRIDRIKAGALQDGIQAFVLSCRKVHHRRDIKAEFRALKKSIVDQNLIDQLVRNRDLEGIRVLIKFKCGHLTEKQANQLDLRKLYQDSSFDRDVVTGLKIKVKKGHTCKELFAKMAELNLNFSHSVSKGSIHYRFTQTFQAPEYFEGRPISLFLVEHHNRLYVRCAWLSQSQSVWRITNKVFQDWISKSDMKEKAIALPIDINLFLHDLTRRPPEKLNSAKVNRLLHSVIAVSANKKDKAKTITIKKRKYFRLPDGDETKLAGESLTPDDYKKVRLIKTSKSHGKDLSPVFYPDFSARPRPVTITSSFYKEELKAVVIPSKCETFNYLFLENSNGHVFLAMVEIDEASLTKHGIKNKYPELEGLDMPLKEYRDQIDSSDIPKSQRSGDSIYVDSWNYLRELPVIQAYCTEFRKRKVPSRID
ncbi:MAG: hypothetical protein LLG04_05895 [Parachlamydia sp.]|nr:hypothetical protein [Parachlamydia sp.]